MAPGLINLKQPRRCKDGFLREYLTYANVLQSPEDFHLWMGLGILACALGRNCYLPRGYFKTYPNLYLVLVGESALTSKSTALLTASMMMQEALGDDLPMFSQKTSTQALIHFLAGQYETTRQSYGIIESSEFSTLIGGSRKDPELMQALTDFWDCRETWSYSTMLRGREKLKNTCLNILAASTPDWLKDSLPESAEGGGFLSRLLLVYRDYSGRRVAHPEDMFTEVERKAYENCIHDLKIISLLAGSFSWTQEAKLTFAEFYEGDMGDPLRAPPSLRGYWGRRGTFVEKLSMLYSAGADDSKKITKRDVMSAITAVVDNEKYLEKLSNFIGTTQDGALNVKVLAAIRRAGVIDHSILLQQFSHRVNSDQMKVVITTLEEAEVISVFRKGKKTTYRYIGGEK